MLAHEHDTPAPTPDERKRYYWAVDFLISQGVSIDEEGKPVFSELIHSGMRDWTKNNVNMIDAAQDSRRHLELGIEPYNATMLPHFEQCVAEIVERVVDKSGQFSLPL